MKKIYLNIIIGVLVVLAIYSLARRNQEVQVPVSVVPPVGVASMSESAARDIAASSECVIAGKLKDTANYNDYTKTWWIDLEIDKPGCNPACVISDDESVEINWRCTGLMVE